MAADRLRVTTRSARAATLLDKSLCHGPDESEGRKLGKPLLYSQAQRLECNSSAELHVHTRHRHSIKAADPELQNV